jgi:hypothetical protein
MDCQGTVLPRRRTACDARREFAGFSDTHGRLDLLALDKQGSLVLIENKLDDTGRDLTWQVLKYASIASAVLTATERAKTCARERALGLTRAGAMARSVLDRLKGRSSGSRLSRDTRQSRC